MGNEKKGASELLEGSAGYRRFAPIRDLQTSRVADD
jgi:hypothetical protein